MKNRLRSAIIIFAFCLSSLFTASAYAEGPVARIIPLPPKRSFTAASIHAAPDLECSLHPAGERASNGLTVFTDGDGYARFFAVRAKPSDAVKLLSLRCHDARGRASEYPVDLTADETFAARPLALNNERGVPIPALKGDPLRYTPSSLIQAGYGLRPDPKDSAAYSRWLAAASAPGRMLNTRRHVTEEHGVTDATGAPWTGSVLTGDPTYTSTIAEFRVPTPIPDLYSTGTTAAAFWNGLGGNSTGSGLIQGGVQVNTTPYAASVITFREYCCGDPYSNWLNGTVNGQYYGGSFTPGFGDEIFSEEWYCDAKGNLNINGGYGCTYLKDITTGEIFDCTTPSEKPCWSVPALPLCSVSPATPNCMTIGLSAEFILELQGPNWPAFSPSQLEMDGAAYASNTDSYSQTISTDSTVTLLQDFTDSVTGLIVSVGTTDQTYWNVFPRYPVIPPIYRVPLQPTVVLKFPGGRVITIPGDGEGPTQVFNVGTGGR